MTNYEMTEKLSEKMGVTMEEAKEALEACGWDMLDAALLLEKEHGIDGSAYSTKQAGPAAEAPARCERESVFARLWRLVKRLFQLGNSNRFEVRRKDSDELALDMPVTAMVLLLFFAFWVSMPLLVIGLFAGFRYSFSGAELGRQGINNAMERAGEAADRVMDNIRKED